MGEQGEELACDYLKKQGYRIVKRNYRIQGAEIDIVAKEGDTLAFIEVKTRGQDAFGHPLESITPTKCRQLSKAALHYLASEVKKECAARFDVVAVWLEEGSKPRFELIKNAFELSY